MTAEAARVEAPAGAAVREEPGRGSQEGATSQSRRRGSTSGESPLRNSHRVQLSGQRRKVIQTQGIIPVGQWEFTGGIASWFLQAFLPDATDQDSSSGVELSALCFGLEVKTTAAAGSSLGFAPSNSQRSSGWRCGDEAEAAIPDEAGAPPGPGASWETETEAALAEAGGSTSVARMVRSNSSELAGGPAPSMTTESSSFSSFQIQ